MLPPDETPEPQPVLPSAETTATQVLAHSVLQLGSIPLPAAVGATWVRTMNYKVHYIYSLCSISLVLYLFHSCLLQTWTLEMPIYLIDQSHDLTIDEDLCINTRTKISLQKLIVAGLTKKLLVFYEIPRCITMFRESVHCLHLEPDKSNPFSHTIFV